MPRKSRPIPTPREPTELTPKGYTVPVPKRDDVLANLKKLARVGSAPRSPQK